MEKLKITEDLRAGLTENGVVICTYKDLNGVEFDCIDLDNLINYPLLEVIEVQINNNIFGL